MRRGFTILELLVASLLLGMLVTILTMIFNQSSIAWRTGDAGLLSMNTVRRNIATVRDEADCLYVWNGELHRTLSIWDERGGGDSLQLKERAITLAANDDPSAPQETIEKLNDVESAVGSSEVRIEQVCKPIPVGSSTGEAGHNWIVNVKSNGPNRKTSANGMGDYDDIFSMPDDFD